MSMTQRVDPARPGSVALVAVLVGMLAGLLAAVFLEVTGEPSIREAINIEQATAAAREHADAAAGHASPGEPEIVSRSVQRGVGLLAAYAISGAAFGLLFAVAFWIMRESRPDPFRRALVAGAVLAGPITVAPWLKYPPNPPAVGDPATLARRQILYVTVICLAAVCCVVAAALSTRLRQDGWPAHRRVLAVLAVIVLPLAAAFALLPPPPDPITVPAVLLWRFRLASLSGNLLLWGVLTLGFGALMAETALRRSSDAGTSSVSTRSP